MRKIFLFLLIPLIIADDAEMLIIKNTIDAGIDAIRQYVQENQVIAAFLTSFFDAIFDMDHPDPNAEILEKLNTLRDLIMNRLDQIENELEIRNKDILKGIGGTIYENSLSKELFKLKAQVEHLVSALNIIIKSKSYSNNEKIVENAYIIGSHQKWAEEGNIVFNFKKLSDILNGNYFSSTYQKDIFQIVYDSFAPNRMFSGEAYDDSDIYIEKIIIIYFYGCSAIFQSLRNTQLMCNFKEKDVESFSPRVKNHFYSAVVDPNIFTTQMKSIADQVFDIKNKDSVVSHYLAFKYKKKFCRNIFINLGKTTPVTIANQIDTKEFSYTFYEAYREDDPYGSCDDCEGYYDNLVKIEREMLKLQKDVIDFNNPNITAILPLQMNEFYDYFLNTYKNNTRFEFLRFLLDKGIDVNELFDERYEMNFFVNLGYRIDLVGDKDQSKCYFNLLHSDGINNSIITRDLFLIYEKTYTLRNRGDGGTRSWYRGVPQGKRNVSRLLVRNTTATVPSTAEEIINSKK